MNKKYWNSVWRTKWLWLASGILLAFCGRAQQANYAVFFTDKQNSPYSVNRPEEFLSPRAVARLERQQLDVTITDLPPNPAYVQGVAATGNVQVREYSRWFNAVLVQATPAEIQDVALLPFVSGVEYLAPAGTGGRMADILTIEEADGAWPSDTLLQLDLLDIGRMRAAGYDGSTVRIAVLDGGFDGLPGLPAFAHLFAANRIRMCYNFIDRDTAVYQYTDHGTKVLSLLAALDTPAFAGIVPRAEYLLFVTEDVRYEYRVEEYRWLIAAEKADSAGADVLLASLGYNTFDDPVMDYTPDQLDGRTAVVTRAASLAAGRGMLVVVSGGNTGLSNWQKVLFPADAVEVLAVGSVDATLQPSSFSPSGPLVEGQVKPDLMALGSGTFVINRYGWVVQTSGTSFAAPQVAGLAAGVWQAYPDITAAGLREALRMSATRATAPDLEAGYGIPSFRAVSHYLEAAGAAGWYVAYPNPLAGDYLYIRITDPVADSRPVIAVYDVLGRPVNRAEFQVTWQDNEAIIAFTGLQTGIYIINLYAEQNFSRFTLIKL